MDKCLVLQNVYDLEELQIVNLLSTSTGFLLAPPVVLLSLLYLPDQNASSFHNLSHSQDRLILTMTGFCLWT